MPSNSQLTWRLPAEIRSTVMLRKVTELAEHRKKCSATYDIQVDGGIGLSNVKEVWKAGAEVFVAGTAVFRGDIVKNVKAFKEEIGVAD